MKFSIYSPIIGLLIISACQGTHKENKIGDSNQLDTVKSNGKQSTSDTGRNYVRSEAPDALTQKELGYALPTSNDGDAQSPINILSSNTEIDKNHEIAFKFSDTIIAVENLGHTIQLDFGNGSASIVDGKTYKLNQLHFHTPSEHLIDGITYPMEMHVVNTSLDQKEGEKPSYLVLGILFKMGSENKFIKEFLDLVPGEENKKENLRPGTVHLKDLFAGIPKNKLETYYNYKGSLTTPPYTESVNWIIRKYIFEASPEQINAIEKLEGDNARHVHDLHQRKVVSY